MKIGVVGLGGLGHMAVKWGKAFGCEVREDARLLGWVACGHDQLTNPAWLTQFGTLSPDMGRR